MPLPTASTSKAGVDAQGVIDLLDGAAHLDLHSIAIARGGAAIARGWWAPYAPDRRHGVYSISKSVTATTVATLVEDGLLGLDDAVLDHLPPAALTGAGEIADVWRTVTVRHCLTLAVGHTTEAWQPEVSEADEPIRAILANPPDAEPGTVFCYNQVAHYLLSRAAEHRGGAPLDVLAQERVLTPLGGGDLVWETDRAGHPWGFSGARMRTDDLLSLVQLWLDRGKARGRQVVPAAWVDEASTPSLPALPGGSSDWAHGYGQSFWVAQHGYGAEGACGQYGLVLPEQRVAIAITSELVDPRELLDLVWQHLLPAVDREGSAESDERLRQRLASLTVPPLGASAGPPEHRSFAVDPASDVTAIQGVQVDAEGSTLTLLREGEPLRIEVGDSAWRSTAPVVDGRTLPVSASGGWTDDGYRAEVLVIETPHAFRVSTGPAGAALTWRQPLRVTDPMLGAIP